MFRLLFILFLGLLSIQKSFAREAETSDYITQERAEIAILDKIVARVFTLNIKKGETLLHDRLEITLEQCSKTPPEFTPESVAYISLSENLTETTITEQRSALERNPLEKNTSEKIFEGWIFASSPGVSAPQHPVYDVWLIKCLS